jgi:hypothetical protein
VSKLRAEHCVGSESAAQLMHRLRQVEAEVTELAYELAKLRLDGRRNLSLQREYESACRERDYLIEELVASKLIYGDAAS